MIDTKNLREEFASLHNTTEAIVAKAVEEKRELTQDEKTMTEANFARMDSIKGTLDQHKKLAEYAFASKSVELPAEPEGKQEAEQVEIQVRDRFDAKKMDRKEFSKAVTNWLSTGSIDRRFATSNCLPSGY